MNGQLILFAVLALVAVVCGILMVVQQNPVRCALNLVMVLFSLAILFLTLNAAFIAAIQVIVYAGAIMVLFIFVIMLLNLGAGEQLVDRLKPLHLGWFSSAIALVLGVIILMVLGTQHAAIGAKLSPAMVGPLEIGQALYSSDSIWLFPFEVVSILLLVAAIGAVMLAKRRI